MRLMQDGAPYHSARTILALASKQSARSAAPWLSRSPDQIPIEHICDVVIGSGDRGPRNVRQLQRFVVEEWDRIAQRTSEVHSHWQAAFEPMAVILLVGIDQ